MAGELSYVLNTKKTNNMTYVIILLAISFIGLGIEMERDGSKKEGKHSFWLSLSAAAIKWWLLYEAGIFNAF